MKSLKRIGKTILPSGVQNLLKGIIGTRSNKKFIEGFDEFCPLGERKKALLAYLPDALLPPSAKRDRLVFSNLGIAQAIPRVLNELGYEVDIAAWDDVDWLPVKPYDLFVGHGGVNFERISKALPPRTIQIYFSTGIYWREFNALEARRIYNLALRRGFLLPPDRVIQFSEDYANQNADGIICLGNENAVSSYRNFKNVIGMNNAVYPVTWNGIDNKDFHEGCRHFLFFSGNGNIHKGLDLLLEAFVGTNLHLHICQVIDAAFAEIYRHELSQPNIHIYGFIPMRSNQFEELALRCNWTISATVCEGQPGAVLECMAYGLLPILTKDANITLDDFGILIPSDDIVAIRASILAAANMPAAECAKRSRYVFQKVKQDYSPEQFIENFKRAVNHIVDARKDCP